MAATSSVNFTSSRRSVGSEERVTPGPLDVEPPGHVKPPARTALPNTGVQKAQSKVSLSVNESGLAVSAPRQTCNTLCRCRSDSRIKPWLGRKSVPTDQPLVPVQNTHGRTVLRRGVRDEG